MTDPLARFREWQEAALAAGVTLPEAMTLATADEAGRPSARTVLLKGVDERGFVFFTNYESRKGRQLAANPHAALTFLWHTEPRRQVLVTGTVEKVSRAIGQLVPDVISWEWSKASRKGRARLDYTQNASIKTLVAPYAVRPAAGAPVSAPITWDELDDPDLRPNSWTIRTIVERVAERGDLFAGAQTDLQELPKV